MTIKERIDLLATSNSTDEDRLQVLIHLVAELADRTEYSRAPVLP
jgi:hypothetical protein